jgi:hypothetical protein
MNMLIVLNTVLLLCSMHFLPTLGSGSAYSINIQINRSRHTLQVTDLADALQQVEKIARCSVHLIVGKSSFSKKTISALDNEKFCSILHKNNTEIFVLKY